MDPEAIILCGGAAKRLKPYLPFNKTIAEISPGKTLLEYQIRWLKKNGIHRIILAMDEETLSTLHKKGSTITNRITFSVEKEKLGTGGAVRQALKHVESPHFYLMNVDDILISDKYTPQDLLNTHRDNPQAAGTILLARTTFPFGIVETSSNIVKNFRQKPRLDLKVCAGHYTFTKKVAEQYFPERGEFENTALPRIAQDMPLYSHEFEGEWITINNLKQLEEARQRLSELGKN